MDDQRDYAEEAANQRLMHEGDEVQVDAPAAVRIEALVIEYGAAFFDVATAIDRADGSTAAAIELSGRKYGIVCERLTKIRTLAETHDGITADARDMILSILGREWLR
jgi:hypothetical protein